MVELTFTIELDEKELESYIIGESDIVIRNTNKTGGRLEENYSYWLDCTVGE